MSNRDDQDLYCLDCGYNVRGLPGDPRRCPECGHLNALADLEVPATLITRELRRMQTGPALCGAAAVALTLWLLPILLLMLHSPASPRKTVAYGLVSALIGAAVAAWGVGATRFRSSCRSKPGWIAALATFHCYALLIAAVCLATLLVAAACVSAPLMGVAVSLPPGLAWVTVVPTPLREVLALLVLPITALFGAWWMYRRAKARIAILQREVAATMARSRDESARPATGMLSEHGDP